ncbi:MaoC domain-containing protein dehydratase [Haloferax elongans ATCC BAA-1513]|uniref:MaoC domain-containing protein dehydratase n=1 Tax=Haloferax elongans ATCC BAA-1513 TaxID=1230453 RepID=M0HUP2_HALEO|nr:MaoC family dehydratase [Haloferax elongans]ELZ87397.1 MaoC domain-containing protein dehydratase [Haloferax elongans ATCC BAA-1513]
MTERSTDTSERRLVSGWHGRFFEDFRVGDVYKHPFGRTVTETDDVWLTNVTMNLNPMHFNEAYASQTEFGERLVNGTVVIALAVGMSVIDVTMNATANLGYDKVKHHAPVYHGDTIFAESEVLETRPSESRNHVGLVTTELRAYNQDGDPVLSLERTAMVLKRESAQPSAATPPGWLEGIGTQPEDVN